MGAPAEIITQEFKLVFTQDNDGLDESQNGQFLEIKTQDCGGGTYYVMSTERWAFDDFEDLIKVLIAFKEKQEKIAK